MRILHLLDIPWWSGLSAYAFDCLKAHQNLGHQVLLGCESDTLPWKKAQKLGWPVFKLQGRSSVHSLSNFIKIKSEIDKFQPQMIVSHTGSTHWAAWWWGKRNKVPVIRTRATSQRIRGGTLSRKIYGETFCILAASKNLQHQCEDFFSHIKVRTLYPPVRISTTSLQNGKSQKIGLIARLDPVKGHFDFLKTAQILQADFPEVEFHFAGSEENIKWSAIFAEARRLGLKKFLYHGFLNENGVAQLMTKCTLGVIASTGSEEVSRVLLEWMASRKSVVATAVGSIPELLLDGKGGFVVSPSKPDEMAEKIKELIQNEPLRAQFETFNFDLAKTKFSQATFESEWKKILDEIGKE